MQAPDACVLVAEDDPLQREVLLELLEMEGYRAHPAGTPGEVLAGLLEAAPDVVLLDLGGMATPTVRAALGRLVRPPPLVVVSGDSAGEQAASELGAAAFLLKPFGVGQLLETLATVLARRRAGGGPPRRGHARWV